MTALDNKDTFFGLRMRKRRTRLAIIFSVFIILAYFDPLKREVDEEAEKSSLGITRTPKGELSAETKAQTMVKSDKPPLATSLRDTHDNSQSSDAIISSQFIFPVGTYPSSHSATIIALDNEEEEEEEGRYRLLASWFAGTEENAPDVAIYTSTYDSRTSSWQSIPDVAVSAFRPDDSSCAVISGGEGCKLRENSLWNPVLVKENENNHVALFYKAGKHPSIWEGYVKRSKDDGKTWEQQAEKLPRNIIGPAKNKILEVNDRLWLAPSSREANAKDGSRNWKLIVERSRDGGKSWDPEENVEVPFDGNAIQPSMWRGDDGYLRMVARTATDYDEKGRRADQVKVKKQTFIRGKKYIIYSKSLDKEGEKWMKAKPTSLPGPNSGIDAVKLRDGRVVIIYNHSWGLKSLGRGKLNVAISHDDGLTWTPSSTVVLESFDDGAISDINVDKKNQKKPIEMSYPAVIQDPKTDLIHIVYTYDRQTIKHVVINPNRL